MKTAKLYLLQTRNGKRTARAAIEIAVDMVNENHSQRDSSKCGCKINRSLLHPNFKEEALEQATVISKLGLQVQVQQPVVFSAEDAKEQAEKVIVVLMRPETSPEY